MISEKQQIHLKKLHSLLRGRKRAPFSDETRAKMSAAKKGIAPFPKGYWKGKKMSLEHRIKIGIGSANRLRSFQERMNHVGEKNGRWTGGNSYRKLRRVICLTAMYADWRLAVFLRDNFICQHCRKRGGKIETDHIKPFAQIIKEYSIKTVQDAMLCKELWNIANGRTLCVACHKKVTFKKI